MRKFEIAGAHRRPNSQKRRRDPGEGDGVERTGLAMEREIDGHAHESGQDQTEAQADKEDVPGALHRIALHLRVHQGCEPVYQSGPDLHAITRTHPDIGELKLTFAGPP